MRQDGGGQPGSSRRATRRARRPAVTVRALASILLLGCALTAHATSPPIARARVSLEWAVERAELIVRGTVRPGAQRAAPGTATTGPSTAPSAASREVTLDVGETIKGMSLRQVTFAVPSGADMSEVAEPWADVLVFLDRAPVATRANVA